MLFPWFIDPVIRKYLLGTCGGRGPRQALGKQQWMEENEKLTQCLSQRAFLLAGRISVHTARVLWRGGGGALCGLDAGKLT